MAVTLPQFTKAMDDAFTETWYEVREQAIDNVLDATVMTAFLREKGRFITQIGGSDITETVKYGNQRGTAVAKGDTLPTGEPELETVARWNWRYLAGHIQRSLFDDQKNNGPFQIKDYVNKRIMDMRDGLTQDVEERFMGAEVTAEGGKLIQGLNDIVPATIANNIVGTYGGVNRPTAYSAATAGVMSTPSTGNTFWGAKYLSGVTPKEVNLLDDMRNIYNSCHNNQVAPDFILTTQAMFQLYESFVEDKTQIVKDAATKLADLGFEVLRFKGKALVWTADMTADHMLFLNSTFIKVKYDPQFWFEMTEFKPIYNQAERVAHILLAMNTISNQLRRHGRLYYL